jgi:hypothetical protein
MITHAAHLERDPVCHNALSRYDALKRLFSTGVWIPHALTPDTATA